MSNTGYMKIINGKKYNTSTAKYLAERENMDDSGNLYYVNEELYQKKTGEFFIFGTGGAGSEYNKSTGINSYCGGVKIVPLDENEARSWVEKYCSGEKYEEIFGEVEE